MLVSHIFFRTFFNLTKLVLVWLSSIALLTGMRLIEIIPKGTVEINYSTFLRPLPLSKRKLDLRLFRLESGNAQKPFAGDMLHQYRGLLRGNKN